MYYGLEEYSKEINEIYDRWCLTPYLDGISPEHVKTVSVMLENERLVLNTFEEGTNKKIAYELIQKIFTDFIPFNLVRFQPLLSTKQDFLFNELSYSEGPFGGSISADEIFEDISAKTCKFNTFIPSNYKSMNTDEIESVAKSMKNEILREIISDLKEDCGTFLNKGNPENLSIQNIWSDISSISSMIFSKTLSGGIDWIFTGPEMAKRIYPEIDKFICDVDEPSYINTIGNNWKLFVDPKYGDNDSILVGRNERKNVAYCYCPYIMFMAAPIVLDPETFTPRRSVMIRYGKKLVDGGQNNYGILKYRA